MGNNRVVVVMEGGLGGGTVDNCEYVDNFHSCTTNVFRKRLMFTTESRKIILGQFGACLPKDAEESFVTASFLRLFCLTAREKVPIKKIEVLQYIRSLS